MFKRKHKKGALSEKETIRLLQDKIQKKGMIEKAMVEIAPLFRYSEKIDIAINTSLKHLVKISNCSRAYVLFMKDPKTLYMKYEYCNKFTVSIKRFLQNIPYKEYGWFRDQTIDKGYISIPDISKIPKEGEEVKDVFDRGRMKAMLAVTFGSQYKFNGTLALVNKKPLKEWDEEIIQFIQFIASMFENVYERKHAEDNLNEALKQAQASNNLKAAIINNLSHEIRTPLNSITGFSHLIANRELSHERRIELSKVIEQNSNRLLNVMGDLLDISQLDSETLEFKKSNFSLNNFISGSYYNYKSLFDSKPDVIFELDIDPNIQVKEVFADEHRLKQIVDSLLSNAYKFTDSGYVVLYCKESEKNIIIGISDTGIGIDSADFKKIFDRFWQANMSLTRIHGGSGLGLSIASALAKKMNYSISFQSKLNEGSDFQLVMPKSEIQYIVKDEVPDVFSPIKRVLVADDFIPIHNYIKKICNELHIECVFVTDGNEAIEAYSNEKFDMVLLDIVMPTVSGTEALRKIKAINPKAVILGQSAYDSYANIGKYIKLGFNDFLIKPYKPKDLKEKIETLIVQTKSH